MFEWKLDSHAEVFTVNRFVWDRLASALSSPKPNKCDYKRSQFFHGSTKAMKDRRGWVRRRNLKITILPCDGRYTESPRFKPVSATPETLKIKTVIGISVKNLANALTNSLSLPVLQSVRYRSTSNTRIVGRKELCPSMFNESRNKLKIDSRAPPDNSRVELPIKCLILICLAWEIIHW